MLHTWHTHLLLIGVIIGVAIGPYVAIGGTIVSTLGSGPWRGGIGLAAMQVTNPHTVSGRGCWPSPLGGQECGQLVSSWVPGSVAWSFVAPSAASADGIDVALGRMPQSSGNEVTIALHGDSSGLPGTLLRAVTVEGKMPPCYAGGVPLTRGVFSSAYPLVSGLRYWVVVSMPASTGGRWDMNGGAPGQDCTGDRVGTGAVLWLGSSTWEPYPEKNLLPNCSAAFRVTSS